MLVTKMSATAPFPELRGSVGNVRYPAFAERKYDGEFNLLHFKMGTAWLVNKYGTKRESFTALDTLQGILISKGLVQATFLCEVFWNDGKLGDLYELLKHKKDDALFFKVFDIWMYEDGDISHYPLIDRKELLHSLVPVPFVDAPVLVHNAKEAEEEFKWQIFNGYEGVVIKSLDEPLVFGPCGWAKMKKKDQNVLEVTNIDPVKERIEVKLHRPDGNHCITGVKVMNKDKATLHIGDKVIIEHQGILETGGLRHPVFIGKETNGNGV